MAKPHGETKSLPAMIVVHDSLQPCPYLPDQVARMPLQWPMGKVEPTILDRLLDAGFRRSGMFVYRTDCPACKACEPTRVDAHIFNWSTGFRRVLKRGDRALRLEIGPPQCDDSRLTLFNRHNQERALDVRKQGPADSDEYRSFLVESSCHTMEWTYWLGEQLVAVATTDYGLTSLSAVYCFFNPEHAKLSLGTYSILKQIQHVKQTGRRYLYLGLYVAENSHLNYKARFVPQERRIEQQWVAFNSDADALHGQFQHP